MKPGESPYAGFDDRPIFIGACPRSGTTLLRSMLNSHPEVALPRETQFVTGLWDSRTDWRHLEKGEVRARLAADIGQFSATKADRFGLDKDELLERLTSAPPTLGSVVGTCFKVYAEGTGKPRWGDKRPIYARYLDMVFAMFPDAQFINLTRDPRATVDSIRRLNWYDGEMPPALDLWVRSVRAVDPWRDCLRSDQILDVRYEDLVADPEAVLAQVATFLRISTDAIPTMLDYHTHVDATATKYHQRLAEPVDAKRINAWTTNLGPGEIALIEDVAGDLMNRCGYEGVATGKPAPELAHSYRAIRRKASLARRKLELLELKRSAAARGPFGARLTSGQLAVDAAPVMPPFWQRHLGKI